MSSQNTFFLEKTTLNCKGKLLSLKEPLIMGILNLTPDSFYDGGLYQKKESYLHQTEKMLQEGADIIDIGGMSSRPGAAVIDVEEELQRVIPAMEKLYGEFPGTVFSIDTVHAKTAKEAINAGASMVNDISAGGLDEAMFDTVAGMGDIPYILMHIQKRPETMQDDPVYDNDDVVKEVIDFFIDKIHLLRQKGQKDIIIDPGFGFGKTLEHNYSLLRHLNDFHIFQLPVLAGISRKSMICKALKVNPESALNGTSVAHTLAVLNGAKILRVHDVKEAKEVLEIVGFFNSG